MFHSVELLDETQHVIRNVTTLLGGRKGWAWIPEGLELRTQTESHRITIELALTTAQSQPFFGRRNCHIAPQNRAQKCPSMVIFIFFKMVLCFKGLKEWWVAKMVNHHVPAGETGWSLICLVGGDWSMNFHDLSLIIGNFKNPTGSKTEGQGSTTNQLSIASLLHSLYIYKPQVVDFLTSFWYVSLSLFFLRLDVDAAFPGSVVLMLGETWWNKP